MGGIVIGAAAILLVVLFRMLLVPAASEPPFTSQHTPVQLEPDVARRAGQNQLLPSTDETEPLALLRQKYADGAEVAALVSPAVVRIDTLEGFGSGFFVHESGVIATNSHVVEGARRAEITLSDGTVLPVERFLTRSKLHDLALLSVNLRGRRVSVARLATNDPMPGEDVMAIGSPQGLDFSVSKGIVSAVRALDEMTLIQTTTPLSPGNSGGPLVNMRGEVIGINTLASLNGQAQNLNFAVSVAELRKLLDRTLGGLPAFRP